LLLPLTINFHAFDRVNRQNTNKGLDERTASISSLILQTNPRHQGLSMWRQAHLFSLIACSSLLWPCVAYCQQTREYDLTTEGVKLLQRIAVRDQAVRDLPKGVAAFS